MCARLPARHHPLRYILSAPCVTDARRGVAISTYSSNRHHHHHRIAANVVVIIQRRVTSKSAVCVRDTSGTLFAALGAAVVCCCCSRKLCVRRCQCFECVCARVVCGNAKRGVSASVFAYAYMHESDKRELYVQTLNRHQHRVAVSPCNASDC